MATNTYVNQWLNLRYGYKTECFIEDRPGILFSDSSLDRSSAIELTLDSWDNLWDLITTGENWLDDVSLECLFVIQVLFDDNGEPMQLSPKEEIRYTLKKGASNSDIRYFLTALHEEVVALRNLRANGGISGISHDE